MTILAAIVVVLAAEWLLGAPGSSQKEMDVSSAPKYIFNFVADGFGFPI